MPSDETIHVLNHVLTTCLDGELGFSNAAQYVESPSLRQVFLARADDCRHAAAELHTEIIALGGMPQDHGSGSGALHRAWLKMRGRLTGHSDQVMLEECERGEDAAKARYRKALDADLPESVRLMLERQLEGTLRNHDQIRRLRDEVVQMPI